MEDAGLEEARGLVYPDAPAVGLFWNGIYVASVDEFALRVLLHVDPELGRELQEMAVHHRSLYLYNREHSRLSASNFSGFLSYEK